MMPDVLYRVRGGKRNDELRYSLRSLANIEHGEVWMIGEVPPWVTGVKVIDGAQHGPTKWHALLADLHTACEHLSGRKLLLMDDDFYVLAKGPVPMLHAGPLNDHVARTAGSYQRSLSATWVYLREQGVKEPLSYELHLPMPIDATRMAGILAPVRGQPLQARTLYGNLAHAKGRQVVDVKVRRGDPVPAGPWLSSAVFDASMERVIRRALPQRGAYEV